MLGRFVEVLNSKGLALRWFAKSYPEEEIILAAAATYLTSEKDELIGWSFSRFLQRKGNLIFSDRRIVFRSNFVSLITLLWIFLGISLSLIYLSGQRLLDLVFLAFIIILILQRRPFTRDIPYQEILRASYKDIRGMTTTGQILMLVLDSESVNLVPSQRVPESLLDMLKATPELNSKDDRSRFPPEDAEE